MRARKVGVVGASGLIGRELIGALIATGVPEESIRKISSREVCAQSFQDCDLALFATTDAVAAEYVPLALKAGAAVVDCSSALRDDSGVPLVVAGVNDGVVAAGARCAATPNCSTALLVHVLAPLQDAFGVCEVVVSTYQAVSGAGRKAVDELLAQTQAELNGDVLAPAAFPEPIAFNVFPHESAVDAASGRNVEECEVVAETRRILELPELRLAVNCVRVPVLRAHSQSLCVTLGRPARLEEVWAALQAAPVLSQLDSGAGHPTPLKAAGHDDVLVGRVRPAFDGDISEAHTQWQLWACGDQLRIGGALNMVRVAELLLA